MASASMSMRACRFCKAAGAGRIWAHGMRQSPGET
jgi:hypothetical protein